MRVSNSSLSIVSFLTAKNDGGGILIEAIEPIRGMGRRPPSELQVFENMKPASLLRKRRNNPPKVSSLHQILVNPSVFRILAQDGSTASLEAEKQRIILRPAPAVELEFPCGGRGSYTNDPLKEEPHLSERHAANAV